MYDAIALYRCRICHEMIWIKLGSTTGSLDETKIEWIPERHIVQIRLIGPFDYELIDCDYVKIHACLHNQKGLADLQGFAFDENEPEPEEDK